MVLKFSVASVEAGKFTPVFFMKLLCIRQKNRP